VVSLTARAVGRPADRLGRPDRHESDGTSCVQQEGKTLNGVPGSPGKATGRARVVTDSSMRGSVEAGDILVVRATSPGETMQIMVAGGLVVATADRFAVFATREFARPCVTAVAGATELIPDGATISIDGDMGTVTIEP
jgi:phosphoenolpyruvate synthase/pyruvate phosphate dikinase